MTRSWRLTSLYLALLLGCGSEGSPPTTSAAIATEPASAAIAPPAPASAASSASPPAAKEVPWLERVLRESDPRWQEWLAQAEALRLQIVVTIVPPDGGPWQVHDLRADAEYFYPASAIKTFLAVAALRALSERSGADVDLLSRIVRCRTDKPGCEPPREDEDKDEPADDEGKKPHAKLRVGDEITKLLSYSDNDSYNRLYDIVGHRELNEIMGAIGFSSLRFHHRMSAPADKSRLTPRVVVRPPGKTPIELPKRSSDFEPAPTAAKNLLVGKAYRDKGGLVEEPMSFATKNYASLRDLQRLNVSLLFPDRPEAAPLGLSDAQRAHVLRAMTTNPKNRKHAAEHSPLSPGVLDVLGPDRVRYVGKSGRAYGFHLENAFVEDTKTHRAFFVTATVYSDPNGVMNDDDYGYDETTKPLLAALGAALSRAILEEPRSP